MRSRTAALLLLAVAARAEEPLAGRPLADAIAAFQQRGLAVIFSSELVRPELSVQQEPQAREPAEALAEILRPHGLALQAGPGGRMLVVRAPRPAAPEAPRDRPATLSFGSEVRVVRVDVTVLDREGRFLRDLGADDLEVYEDGRRQTTASFTRREVPLSLVLLLDASSSIEKRLGLSKAAARGFLETLGTQDEASVVQFNDAVRVLQAMTSDARELRAAVDAIQARGSTALYNALFTALKSVPAQRGADEVRRRAVLLLSDGEDTSSLVWEEQVLELARRREAAIHVIDLGPREAGNRSARLLRLLSTESGGDLHRPRGAEDLPAVYSRIGEELRSQYTVGYHSTGASQDGAWRRIEVRVRGRRDVQVRHRTGYYAQP